MIHLTTIQIKMSLLIAEEERKGNEDVLEFTRKVKQVFEETLQKPLLNGTSIIKAMAHMETSFENGSMEDPINEAYDYRELVDLARSIGYNYEGKQELLELTDNITRKKT